MKSTARAMALALLALAAFALALLRLRRVAMPRYVPLATFAGTRVHFGRVELARKGSPHATLLGHAVVCRGREVISWPGRAAPTVREIAGRITVQTPDDRIVSVDPSTCAVR